MFMNKWARLCFLVLGGGTIFKLSSMKDVFYVPMQNDWGLTNTQIGLSFTVYTIVQTTGLFLSLYIADRYSKKILLPFGLIGVGLCGLYLSTLPSFTGYLICFAAMAFFADVVYWPVLLKAVRLLGTRRTGAVVRASGGRARCGGCYCRIRCAVCLRSLW
jgi:sugar phosphate permease